jgi:hypothetical protein
MKNGGGHTPLPEDETRYSCLVAVKKTLEWVHSSVEEGNGYCPDVSRGFTHALRRSIGSGNTMVVFCSAPISVSVCK